MTISKERRTGLIRALENADPVDCDAELLLCALRMVEASERRRRSLSREIRNLHRARKQDFEAGKRWRKEFLAHSERLLTELTSCRARIVQLEAAAQSAIFALQPNWATDPASSASALGRAVAAHRESLQALAKGCDYVAASTDGYDGLVADPMLALGLLAVVGTDEDGDPKYKRIRPEVAPIPALPEGGAQLRKEVTK